MEHPWNIFCQTYIIAAMNSFSFANILRLITFENSTALWYKSHFLTNTSVVSNIILIHSLQHQKHFAWKGDKWLLSRMSYIKGEFEFFAKFLTVLSQHLHFQILPGFDPEIYPWVKNFSLRFNMDLSCTLHDTVHSLFSCNIWNEIPRSKASSEFIKVF